MFIVHESERPEPSVCPFGESGMKGKLEKFVLYSNYIIDLYFFVYSFRTVNEPVGTGKYSSSSFELIVLSKIAF